MFFSFNSEIVIVTYGDLAEAEAGGNAEDAPKGAARLCCAPLRFGCDLRFLNNFLAIGLGDVVQHFVGCVLNTRTGFVKLASRLGGKLAKRVSVT